MAYMELDNPEVKTMTGKTLTLDLQESDSVDTAKASGCPKARSS